MLCIGCNKANQKLNRNIFFSIPVKININSDKVYKSTGKTKDVKI